MIGEWLVTHLYRLNGHCKSWHRHGWSWEWEFYLPGPDLMRAIHWGWTIWYPGGRAKYLFARPCVIRDKWGNCDKTEPRHTSHHIPHPVTLSGPVSVTPGGRVSTEFNPKLVAYFTRDNPGHIGHEPQAAAGEIPRIDKMSCEWGWGRCHYGPLPRVCHRR